MKLLLSVCLSVLAIPSALAQSGAVVVNVNGISCINAVHQTGFNATSYSLGGTVKTGRFEQSNAQSNAQSSIRPPSLSDLSVAKNFDACSEPLIRLFLGSTVIPTVTLIQYSTGSGERPFAALTITLTNAIMTSYEVTGAPDVHPTQVLLLTYKKVSVISISQNPDGTTQAPVTVCYDAAKNQWS
jgi:type VI protein secretion system component Hcp